MLSNHVLEKLDFINDNFKTIFCLKYSPVLPGLGICCCPCCVQPLNCAQLLRPHGLQHSRHPCPSLSQSLLKLMSIELVMLSKHLILCHPLFLLLQSFLPLGSFLMNQLFASDGQSIGATALASVLPMNIQG